jgi:hypothetical protein
VQRVADWKLRGMQCSIGRQCCICAGFSMRWLPASVPWQYNQGHSSMEGGHIGAIRLPFLGRAV